MSKSNPKPAHKPSKSTRTSASEVLILAIFSLLSLFKLGNVRKQKMAEHESKSKMSACFHLLWRKRRSLMGSDSSFANNIRTISLPASPCVREIKSQKRSAARQRFFLLPLCGRAYGVVGEYLEGSAVRIAGYRVTVSVKSCTNAVSAGSNFVGVVHFFVIAKRITARSRRFQITLLNPFCSTFFLASNL